jgi:hypothetical protein
MKAWLTYAPIALILLFVYIVIKMYKSQKQFSKETGVNTFNPFASLRFLFRNDKNFSETAAYEKLKAESKRLLRIWIVAIVLFIVITFIVGILTAPAPKAIT